MRDFLKNLIIDVFVDERVQAAIRKLVGSVIAEQILPLVPVATAAAAKAAVDQIIEKVPALEGVVDAVKVAEDARDSLNSIIPDIDLGIPVLDELMDFWRPK